MATTPDPRRRDDGDDPGELVAWRSLLAETEARLVEGGIEGHRMEARWMVEEATGMDSSELIARLDEPATVGGVARLDAMVERRLAGEPIQYVLGRWAFRSLDVLVDRRVLIPRPETEQVVEVALHELDAVVAKRTAPATVVDLGTGSGVIGLSIAAERPGTHVWAVDASAEALAVARANLAALGMAAGRVRLEEGTWFAPLPDELRGRIDLVVSNPPYIAADEVLPASVQAWEPHQALVAGPTGLEAYEVIVAEAPRWLRPGGALVLELGATQARSVEDLAARAGLAQTRVVADHAGHQRSLVARRSASGRVAFGGA